MDAILYYIGASGTLSIGGQRYTTPALRNHRGAIVNVHITPVHYVVTQAGRVIEALHRLVV